MCVPLPQKTRRASSNFASPFQDPIRTSLLNPTSQLGIRLYEDFNPLAWATFRISCGRIFRILLYIISICFEFIKQRSFIEAHLGICVGLETAILLRFIDYPAKTTDSQAIKRHFQWIMVSLRHWIFYQARFSVHYSTSKRRPGIQSCGVLS